MKYFSGFSLHNEEVLFSEYISNNETTVVGFSYGAQKAFEYASNTQERIDRLVLLSPAFFQTQEKAFIRTQLRHFKVENNNYVKQFLLNVAHPSHFDLSQYVKVGTKDELETLLTYVWKKEKIQKLLDNHISIEVFLGEEDKIIDIEEVKKFFSMATTYTIKNVGHLLKEKYD